ncbi:hypothetical protein AOQ84DRAFT_372707 [Glonium stellatum]|uniref:DUF7791 domain-containing protein n=1 Tax=Glonium stellatum TaxID=574774 RepID=A0A8E2JX76_9PEZI|nr:hypothetical protein AOQ84DRAFT_372707 [Glonium stellatum]
MVPNWMVDTDEECASWNLRVQYIHRTAKDFLESGSKWREVLDATGHESFDPNEHWANAFLWMLKTLGHSVSPERVWNILTWCIEYALILQLKRRVVQVTYLDEIFRVYGVIQNTRHLGSIQYLNSPLDLAVWCNLADYVRIKVKELSQQQCEHALVFYGKRQIYTLDLDSAQLLLRDVNREPSQELKRARSIMLNLLVQEFFDGNRKAWPSLTSPFGLMLRILKKADRSIVQRLRRTQHVSGSE